jgi:predicted phage tail protein
MISKVYPFSEGEPISSYVKKADFPAGRIIVNGAVITRDDYGIRDGDEIIIAPAVRFDPYTWAAIGSYIWTAVVYTAVSYAVSYGINSLFARKPSRGTTSSGLDESSQTYGWDGIRTTQEIGTPVPIVYGEHMVGGNIVNQFLSLDGDKHYVNALIALGEGEIDSISSVYINDNPRENFDGITYEEKLGTNTQSVIANFEDLHDVNSVNVSLTKNNAHTYTTVLTNVKGFDINLTFPSGLFQVGSDGSVSAWSVTYRVEYKIHTDGSYTDLGTTTISYTSRTSLHRIYSKRGLTAGQYDIRVTRTSDDSSISPTMMGDLTWTSLDEIRTDDLAYPNTALIGIKALATDQLNGSTPNFTIKLKGKKISVPDVKNGGTSVAWANYYYDSDTSQYKLLSDGTVLSWDGTTYITAWSANPVWCLYDLLVNTRYGLGESIDSTMIDLPSFVSMSKYCENRVPDGNGGYEKRLRLDIVLDGSTRALDMVVQIAQSFRGLVFYSSGTIKIKIDKQGTPVQLFGMGNIVQGSFSQSWLGVKDRFNVVEVQYLDSTKLYAQEKIAVFDDASIVAGDPVRKQDLRVFCTSVSQAYREARFFLWRNKYIKRAVSFQVGIDAICCEAGDLISISHDVPAWGASGRVVSGTSNTITIDKDYTLESGKTYAVSVRHADDSIEEKTITTAIGTYSTFTISGTFATTPSAYDVFAIGEITIETKPFRVQDIKINGDHTAEINAIEYNASIYDDTAPSLPPVYSQLDLGLANVSNLSLTERLVVMNDGTIQSCIDVWWGRTDLTSYKVMANRCRVYLSDNGGSSYVLMGETSGTNYSIISNLVDGLQYKVVVVSLGVDGSENAITGSPSALITLVGKSAPPADVTAFLCNQSRDRLYFSWAGVSDLDLSGYEIRYGQSWDVGYALATQLKSTRHIELSFPEGTISYWIKAIDTTGNYSDNATEAVITVDNIPFVNIIDEWVEETAWSGTKTDVSKVGDNLELNTGILSGTYVTSVRDIGYVASFRIGIEDTVVDATSSVDTEWDDSATLEFDDSETARFSGTEISGAVTYEIKTSDDNVTWSAYRTWQAGEYRCRYFQIRATLTRASAGTTLQLTNMYYYADLPDVDEMQDATVSVAGTGAVITFAKTFHEDPALNVTILTGSGVYWLATSLSTTGVTIKLYDTSGTAQTGTLRVHIHGV